MPTLWKCCAIGRGSRWDHYAAARNPGRMHGTPPPKLRASAHAASRRFISDHLRHLLLETWQLYAKSIKTHGKRSSNHICELWPHDCSWRSRIWVGWDSSLPCSPWCAFLGASLEQKCYNRCLPRPFWYRSWLQGITLNSLKDLSILALSPSDARVTPGHFLVASKKIPARDPKQWVARILKKRWKGPKTISGCKLAGQERP